MYSYSPLTLEESNLPVWKVLLGILLPSLIFFIAIDICWITFVAGSAFQQVLAGLMRPTPDPVAGLLAGMIIVGGVLFFVTLKARTKAQALTQGLLLGSIIFAVYELTNYSVIASWTFGLVAMDTIWGAFSCGVTAVLQQQLGMWLKS
mmetsp:Transcript_8815/g.23720  ORF Transcript_8815/g.23720 Transcript_8815/m.23720 type:complete len:148 (+) Transcript_8815:88-531(+)